MRIQGVCSACGRSHERDCPQGEAEAWFQCSCGNTFGIVVLMEPYGHSFVYGIEALARRRWSDACTHFATSFEVFQKSATGLLLAFEGLKPELASLIASELRLTKDNLSTISKAILGSKPPSLGSGNRNAAVHKGTVPPPEAAARMGAELLAVFEGWIKPMSELVHADFDRLWAAYERRQTLPEDVSRVARGVFDLSVTHALLKDQWDDPESGSRKVSTARFIGR